jgi:hypothetical protein
MGGLYRRETFGGWEESGSAKGKTKISLSNKGWLYIILFGLCLLACWVETWGSWKGKGGFLETTLLFSSRLFVSSSNEEANLVQHKSNGTFSFLPFSLVVPI